jgi:hypothetical protein
MASPLSDEMRRLTIASVACTLIGAAVAVAFIVTAPPIGFRLVILAAIALGAILTKTASAIATFTGWIILVPVACAGIGMLIALGVAIGGLPGADNPAWLIIGVPAIAYFASACVVIKMDT